MMDIKYVDWVHRLDMMLATESLVWEDVAQFMPHHYYLLGKTPEIFMNDMKEMINDD